MSAFIYLLIYLFFEVGSWVGGVLESQHFQLLSAIATFLSLDALLLCNARSHIMDHCCLLHLAELWTSCVTCICVLNKVQLRRELS